MFRSILTIEPFKSYFVNYACIVFCFVVSENFRDNTRGKFEICSEIYCQFTDSSIRYIELSTNYMFAKSEAKLLWYVSKLWFLHIFFFIKKHIYTCLNISHFTSLSLDNNRKINICSQANWCPPRAVS